MVHCRVCVINSVVAVLRTLRVYNRRVLLRNVRYCYAPGRVSIQPNPRLCIVRRARLMAPAFRPSRSSISFANIHAGLVAKPPA